MELETKWGTIALELSKSYESSYFTSIRNAKIKLGRKTYLLDVTWDAKDKVITWQRITNARNVMTRLDLSSLHYLSQVLTDWTDNNQTALLMNQEALRLEQLNTLKLNLNTLPEQFEIQKRFLTECYERQMKFLKQSITKLEDA